MQNMLVGYICRRNHKGEWLKNEKVGVVMAVKTNDGVFIAASRCKKPDTFSKASGKALCLARIEKRHSSPIPHTMRNDIMDFVEKRAKPFFRTDKVTVLGE